VSQSTLYVWLDTGTEREFGHAQNPLLVARKMSEYGPLAGIFTGQCRQLL
jgi:hypothetical protein